MRCLNLLNALEQCHHGILWSAEAPVVRQPVFFVDLGGVAITIPLFREFCSHRSYLVILWHVRLLVRLQNMGWTVVGVQISRWMMVREWIGAFEVAGWCKSFQSGNVVRLILGHADTSHFDVFKKLNLDINTCDRCKQEHLTRMASKSQQGHMCTIQKALENLWMIFWGMEIILPSRVCLSSQGRFFWCTFLLRFTCFPLTRCCTVRSITFHDLSEITQVHVSLLRCYWYS